MRGRPARRSRCRGSPESARRTSAACGESDRPARRSPSMRPSHRESSFIRSPSATRRWSRASRRRRASRSTAVTSVVTMPSRGSPRSPGPARCRTGTGSGPRGTCVTLESRIALQARSYPASIAARALLPARSSSRMRSRIRMFASTAMPTVSTMPAMPGSVSVKPNSAKAPSRNSTFSEQRQVGDRPRRRGSRPA